MLRAKSCNSAAGAAAQGCQMAALGGPRLLAAPEDHSERSASGHHPTSGSSKISANSRPGATRDGPGRTIRQHKTCSAVPDGTHRRHDGTVSDGRPSPDRAHDFARRRADVGPPGNGRTRAATVLRIAAQNAPEFMAIRAACVRPASRAGPSELSAGRERAGSASDTRREEARNDNRTAQTSAWTRAVAWEDGRTPNGSVSSPGTRLTVWPR